MLIVSLLTKCTWYSFIAVGLAVYYYFLISQGFSYRTSIVVGSLLSAIVIWTGTFNSPKHYLFLNKHFRFPLLLIFILLVGAFIRAGWVYLVPPLLRSDYLDYWNAARQLLETGSYFNIIGDGHILRSFRPPGYPFALAAAMYVFGEQPWLPMLMNISFYILTGILIYSIAWKLINSKAAMLAASFFAVWPSDIMRAGIAGTESFSLFLWTASFWAFMIAYERHNWWYAVLAGFLAGYGSLVRASTLLIPVLWALFSIMTRQESIEKVKLIAIPVIAMVLTIMPWTIRNYYVLGEPLPVSSNGGDVFYRANNALASGTWSPRGEIDLDVYKHNEVLWNQKGYEFGKKWIAQNPAKFVKLALKKQAILLGDDSHGAYSGFFQQPQNSERLYGALCKISNIWWLGMWILAVIGAIKSRQFLLNSPSALFLLLMILYFVAIHSVFESQSRYHMSFIGFLSIISALAVYPVKSSDQI